MMQRLFGVETEYALSAIDARGARICQTSALETLMRVARRQLLHLPDAAAHGIFLRNGARFYVDCGGHPELTTPECNDPWDVVRYVRAGEAILLRLADRCSGRRGGRRVTFFRGNVDYSGSGSTWGSHESYMHRLDPDLLPEQIIPHLVSRLVYTGAGGFKNGGAGIEFTLSPRAAHIAKAISSDSTCNRAIFHDKREHLCKRYRRLHVICGESLGSELATGLRIGCTALVVAMSEAGLRPGEAVAFRDPVAAMHLYAGDPTCTAAAETVRGERLTAVAVQRHYLALAEAHLGSAFMPAWAGDVCRRWGAVLDGLESGWEAVATTLDWAIKLGLYKDRVRRRGLRWESLPSWTSVAEKLSAACARATHGEARLTAELALEDGSPIAAEVARMTPAIERMGLSWRELGAFLAVRHELFEIDTRFGELGRNGVFSKLEAGGLLTQRVVAGGDIARAVDHPPLAGRARLRGRLVRELAGKGDRYACSWQTVWDHEAGTCVDMSDPFAVTPEWKDMPGKRDAPRILRLRVGSEGPAPGARTAPVLDPVALNREALFFRHEDDLEQAERLLRQAIALEDAQVPASSPKRPHRRNNLAIVLMRAGELDEASRVNAEAWRLKAGAHDLTSGRILFVRLSLALLLGDDVDLYVGQLKTLLAQGPPECRGDISPTWDIPDVLDMLSEQLDTDDAEPLHDLAEVLNDYSLLPSLAAWMTWTDAPAVPLETPWSRLDRTA